MRPKVEETRQIAVRLDKNDEALLNAAAEHLRLSVSDTLRRALRELAESIGVDTPKRPKKEKRLL
jgi:uncharacterized protein (DUF1778 family)